MNNKKIDYDEIINRMGFFMNKANLSARATSFRFDRGEQFMKRILNKKVELKVKTLLEFFEIVDITPPEGKQTIIDLMKQLK